MEYRLPCECGRKVTVTESSAGSSVPCDCGRLVAVPALSELRHSAEHAVPEPALPSWRKLGDRMLGLVVGAVLMAGGFLLNMATISSGRSIRPGSWLLVVGTILFFTYGIKGGRKKRSED